MELFNPQYGWYKGNMHTHTTVSDGQATPEEAMRLYAEAGYDFLVLTDHNRLNAGGMYNGMLVLRGVELACASPDSRKAWHFVAVEPDEGVCGVADFSFGRSGQAIIDHILAHHGFCILAHPDWSLMGVDDIEALRGFQAVEVLNTVCDPGSRGDASRLCDTLASRGRPLPLVASDDTHRYTGDQCHSAVWVSSPSGEKEDLLRALRDGAYYASEGPRFRSIRLEDGRIHVRATPSRYIHFFNDVCGSGLRVNCEGIASNAAYDIKPNDRCVRVQLTDFAGLRAWSGYIDVKNGVYPAR